MLEGLGSVVGRMGMNNDTRGWIMTALSGIACMLGSFIICIDPLVRLLPAHKHFRLQESNDFLSSSLSLSFGVMLWSALFNMLPNSKNSLLKGGFSSKAASWTLFLCFLAGAAGIQVVSKIAHRYIPSHIIECDHSHEEQADHDDIHHDHAHSKLLNPRHELKAHANGSTCDYRASLTGHADKANKPQRRLGSWASDEPAMDGSNMAEVPRRPPLSSNWTDKVTKVLSSTKPFCDEHGQCLGYTDPCGNDCFKIVDARGGIRVLGSSNARAVGLLRTNSTPHRSTFPREADRRQSLGNVDEETPLILRPQTPADGQYHIQDVHSSTSLAQTNGHTSNSPSSKRSLSPASSSLGSHHGHSHSHEHHHHVPQNAFLSIGLQTSIAIALHKLPEGFITYATNHANPRLGFSVFLALFIHNITEGFAMALPLFLAMRNRPKAVVISSLLGGISQPLGAGVAALWFKLAGSGDSEPGEGVYGVMFAIVAGIMTSVALQLFSESLDLTHNRQLCMAFAFVGMGVLGFTSALTAR